MGLLGSATSAVGGNLGKTAGVLSGGVPGGMPKAENAPAGGLMGAVGRATGATQTCPRCGGSGVIPASGPGTPTTAPPQQAGPPASTFGPMRPFTTSGGTY